MVHLRRKKYLRLSREEWYVLVFIFIATLLRFVLIALNWPVTNSDEGNMGILARHVAFNGEWPIFFYGLPYLGPFEGYLAAPLFHLFGPSTFTLRLALLPFFSLFLLCMYYLTRLLYTARLAVFTVVLLSFGSDEIIRRQIRAVGEYPETLFFAAFICLVVFWLVLSAHKLDGRTRTTTRRIVVYAVLGLVVGCALWVDFLILPILGTACILLLLFCRRELVSWAGLSCLAGLLIGAFPLLYYNITAPLSSNSIAILLSIQHSGSSQHLPFLQQLVGAVMISLPNATGFTPLFPEQGFPYFGKATNIYSLILQGGWGVGYLLLLAFVTLLTASTIWQGWRGRALVPAKDRETARQERVRQCCQLMLLVSASGTILLYAISPAAAVFPGPTARYLECVLVATPALCWPLWNSGVRAKAALQRRAYVHLIQKSIFSLLLTLFVMGTFLTFLQVPAAEAAYAQQDRLVQRLLTLHATRIYSEYWTCNRLTFQSEEKIICSSLDEKLQPGFDRYAPYRDIVKASPLPGYIFPLGFQQIAVLDAKLSKDNQFHALYQRQVFEGYVFYVPK